MMIFIIIVNVPEIINGNENKGGLRGYVILLILKLKFQMLI